MSRHTRAERRIQALQAFVNDQCFSMISFCLALPFGGEKLLEQMLRELAEYHTENSLVSDLFVLSHNLPEKKFSPEEALSFVVDIHIKEGFMEKEWFRISPSDERDSFSVQYNKEKCFYYGHCYKLVCDGFQCVCVRRFFYEGIIKKLTGESYTSTLLTKNIEDEFCKFSFKKVEQEEDEVKKYKEKIYDTYKENSRLNEAVKFRTMQLEVQNKYLQSEITERKITESKLKETQHKLKKAHGLLEEKVKERTLQLEFANKELEAFNFTVSHDLRTPLRHISSFSRLLKEELASNTNKNIDEYSTIIVEATEKMDRLLNDLLNYSKAGSAKIKKTSVNLNSIIQKIRAEFELETRGREINWKTAVLPLTEGDPSLIKLALTNLISNALKYTGKLKSATIETGHFVDAHDTTVFFVKDNGIGFDMKFKAILFDPFKRFHEHTDFEGSGLGLSNVKRIIELHGGSIWADSVVNSGTTFYFTLPIHKDPDESMNKNLKINKGDEIHGFVLKKITSLKALKAAAYELEHKKSGARLLHIYADDQETLLSIAFRTPPPNDTGLPHILEHSVLGGSKKFPVKEPFVELLKMSMATFINAMTYPDKTVYPVASNVKKDFWNLADVYFDACFHPNISEQTLKQEGHHLDFKEPGNTDSPLIVKGIVYNEMKGVYSSPDSLVSRYLLHHIFPDTPYGKDSGGDPDKIPDLTFKQFESFFRNYYHPANSYTFSFGDISTEELCKFLDTRLQGFEKISVNTLIPFQPAWKAPLEASYTYPIGDKDTDKGKSFLSVAWLTGSGTDPEEVFEMEILEQLLLGSAAATLTRAIVDSHLGDDIISIGYQAGMLETFFAVGVRGSEPDRKEAFQKVIDDSLKEIVNKNFESSKVEAAFRQIEYSYLEIPSMYPLWLMDRAYSTWVYDADPLIFLEAEKHIENVKKKYADEPMLFENLVKKKFLENPHRFALAIVPERGLAKKREDLFAEKMANKKKEYSEDELKGISREALELELLQNTPNSQENLKTLPQLRLSDIPKKPVEIPSTRVETPSGVPLLLCDVFSNGVSYFNISFDLTGLPEPLYDYLPLYCFCVSKMGAGGQDYLETASLKEANTAGISASVSFIPHSKEDGKLVQRLTLQGKSLNRTFDEFLAIIRDIIFTLDFSDFKRLKDVLRQKKSRLVSGMSSGGMTKAALWAGRGANLSGYINNQVSGVPQFWHIHSLVDGFEGSKDEIREKLESIKNFLLNRKRLFAAVTAPEALSRKAVNVLESISKEMTDEPVDNRKPEHTLLPPEREALIYPSDVSYCTWRIDAVPGFEPDGPMLKVLENLLRYGYLWEEVRAKGGAYGAPVAYLENARAFRISSYRDPNISKTLQVFDKTLDYIKKTEWSQTQIDHAVIATAKADNSPIRPAGAASEALFTELLGESLEFRIWKREKMLEATPEKVKTAALRLLENKEPRVCVFSGPQILEAETRKMESPLKVEDILAPVENNK